MDAGCSRSECRAPAWMGRVLAAAGICHLAFALWANLWPHQWFDWSGLERPNFPLLWRGLGLISAGFGIGFLFAARAPLRHWTIVLAGFVKMSLAIAGFAVALMAGDLPARAGWIVVIDDLVWWPLFAAILWAAVQVHAGRPPSTEQPLTVAEAVGSYQLSTGETLAEASRGRTLALVFLRHFGCTFTRQLLRGLEQLEADARRHDAHLVLVHMLQRGNEREFLDSRASPVARVADPMCELYRAFGLGKAGFLELFGPRVWLRGVVALFQGCGVGHLAGDGLQMPGAFLLRDGRIIARQPARSAADLPDLPRLFDGAETLPAGEPGQAVA